MKPIAVIPMNDPTGLMFPHLKEITPILKTIFDKAFVSLNQTTQKSIPEMVSWLTMDEFFSATLHETDLPIGSDFLQLYSDAASVCGPTQVLHLCFIDRLAYALQSNFRDSFLADIQKVAFDQAPLIFARSQAAWDTHPQNYHDAEQMVVTAGYWLFGKTFDFSWCYIVIQAQQLLKIIPKVQSEGISFFAEVVLAIKDDVAMQYVDWLSWEDPFILQRDAIELKMEREADINESRKRLATAIPMLQHLQDAFEASN